MENSLDANPRSLSSFSTFGASNCYINGNGHTQVPVSQMVNPPDVIPTVITVNGETFKGRVKAKAPPIPKHAHTRSLVEHVTIVPSHGYSKSLLDEEVLPEGQQDVTVFLGPGETRFGFSVVGGIETGMPPRIDKIHPGSPADKADLEVGDEILEVNGKNLEDASHTEVISHIHQCIRSRTICLRVKRRTGNKLAADLAASSNVQDAFVIAVEQRARERLERLSALKKIKPVDMTKLSSQFTDQPRSGTDSSNHDTPTSPDKNGVLESSPIYVTSVPNLTASTRSESDRRSGRSSVRATSSPSPRHKKSSPQEARHSSRRYSEKPSKVTNGHSRSRTTQSEGEADGGSKSGDELELKHDLSVHPDHRTSDDPEGISTAESGLDPSLGELTGDSRSELDDGESADSLPGTPEKTYGLGLESRDFRSNREVLLDPPPPSTSNGHQSARSQLRHTTSIDSKDSASSRKSGTSVSSSSKGAKTGGPAKTPLENTNMIAMIEFDPTNKEMAVDVPDTFIGRTKTPPRYPPPKTHSDNAPNYNNNNYFRGASSQRSHTNGTLPKQPSPPTIPVQTPTSEQEANRLKKYEEDLRLRREREEQQNAEWQRTSLRESQKLRDLASIAPPQGVYNAAFDHDESSKEDVELNPMGPKTPVKAVGMTELIGSLQRIQGVLKSNGHHLGVDISAVSDLISNPDFQNVLQIHNKVQESFCVGRPPSPETVDSQVVLGDVLDEITVKTTPETVELAALLGSPTLEGLLYAQDRVAARQVVCHEAIDELAQDPMPIQEAINTQVSYPMESNVKLVRIDKTVEPLGATIRNENDAVIIGRIVRGGAAEKSGLLHEGDEILEVNGQEVRGKCVNDVCDMLAGMTGTLSFMIIPNTPEPSPIPIQPMGQTMHVKAHFDYDPEEDLYIPCRELGMSFQKGEILHVMNQSDSNWWQAYRDGEKDQSLAGLIPSKQFQQQREAARQTVADDVVTKDKSKKAKLLCAKKQHKRKKKKKMLYPNYNEDYNSEEILTYEEVALYYPRINRKRPVVLIGPPNIGRHELRQKLMEDTERFAAAVPHTSRARKDSEIDGQDYHFITRPQFESMILSRRFVEHGEYERAYYGTSVDAIRHVIHQGRICVLNLHPVALEMLRSSDLKPHVVLIAPPALEKLRHRRNAAGLPFKEEELKETIEKAREMEDMYGHYFDQVIINQDLERTYQILLQHINMLEREPQWVPAAWLKDEP